MKTYKYNPPRYFEKDKVYYTHHNGSKFAGLIVFVETHYGGADRNKAYHIYSIMRTDKEYDERPGFRRYRRNAIHVGEESIINLIS